MFDSSSRYADALVKTEIYRRPDGVGIPYKRRRLPPAQGPAAGEAVIQPNDRLDLMAARTLGNPELFWRLCDANLVLNPFDACARPGRRLRIPGPAH